MRHLRRLLVLAAVLTLCLALASVSVFAAKGPGCSMANDGNHYNRDGTAEKSVGATCTEDGYDVYTCLLCGEEFKVVTQKATGHSYGDWQREKNPTCTQPGRDVRKCGRCGNTETREVAPAGHKAGAPTRENEKPATCTQGGSYDEVTKCTVCGTELSRSTKTTAALGHSFGEWQREKNPTCTQAGRDVRKCSRCGASETREVAAAGHKAGTPARENEKQPTCTEEGSYDTVTKCTVCGEVITRTTTKTEALGHDWDDGTVQESEDAPLHDHDVVYTCRRCGKTHTETMKISLMSLWPKLYHDPIEDPDADDLESLTITEQPKDLEIAWEKGNMGTLTIKAEGGLIPYTFRWIIVPGDGKKGVTDSFFAAQMESMGSAWAQAAELGFSFGLAEGGTVGSHAAKPAVFGPLSGFPKSAAAKLIGAEGGNDTAKKPEYDLIPANALITETQVPELQVEVGDAPSYTAWCVVFDKKGDYVTSEKVQIIPGLTIVLQPRDINMDDPEAFFTVGAAYGEEPYTYQWQYNLFGTDDYEDIDEPDARGETLKHIPGMDRVRCVVTDKKGKSVTSKPADAYVAPVLTLTAPEEILVRPGEEAGLTASFHGGTAPYTAKWEKYSGTNENILKTYEFAEDPNDAPVEYELDASDGGSYGLYRFEVVDGVGQMKEAFVNCSYRGLTIQKQPEDGELDFGGKYEASIEMGEGTLPFTYSLRDASHKEIASETISNTVWNTTVTESGIYYIYVRDANGLHTESELFSVGNYEVRITIQPDTIKLTDPKCDVCAELLIQGGEGPYQLTWLKANEKTGRYDEIDLTQWSEGSDSGYADGYSASLVTENWGVLKTNVAGKYLLEATDKNNFKALSKAFYVIYTGSVPYITVQPQEIELESRGGRSMLSYYLDCEAKTGTNDYLAYLWEYYAEDGTWQNVPVQTMYSRDSWYHGPFYADYPHQKFDLVDRTQMYRCKVTNTKTGESAYSESVMARILFKTISSGQSGKDNAIYAEFGGGAWPATFLVREKYPPIFDDVQALAGTDGDNRTYTLPDFVQYWDSNGDMGYFQLNTINDMEEAIFTEYNCLVSNVSQDIFIHNLSGATYCSAEGLARRWWPPTKYKYLQSAHSYYHRLYQIRIEDRFGDSCTCPWIRMTSPMTDSEKAYNFFWFGLLGVEDNTDHGGW